MSRRSESDGLRRKGTSLPNVFLSYSRDDAEIARRLVNDLRSLGISISFDLEVSPGEDFPTVLTRLLSEADAVLVLISPHSLQSSWVKREWSQALSGRNKRVIPALVGGVTVANLPSELKRVPVVDLNRDYDSNLRRLYETLSEAGSSSAPSIAETVDVDQIAKDVTTRVLKQLGSSDQSPTKIDTAARPNSKLIFVICSFQSDMSRPSKQSLAPQPHTA